jgi:hypothetical protein
MLEKQKALDNADALLALGLDESTFTWWFDFYCLGKVVRIRPVRLVHLAYSTDCPDLDHAPYNVIEARIEYRRMTPGELASSTNVKDPPERWILSVYGGAEILIVCEDFAVETAELADRYPAPG